jgi:anti-sigma factor RsiW
VIHDEAARLLAAGAVLDDLEPEERAAYAAHRAACGACERLERELDAVLADLALAVPERVPPPGLLGDIRRILAGESGSGPGRLALATAAPAAGAVPPAALKATPQAPWAAVSLPSRRLSRLPLAASLAAAAVFAVVAAGLGVRTLHLGDELGAARAQVASLEVALAGQADAVTVALNPAHVTVALHAEPVAPTAEAAVVYVPGTATAWLVARNLPATPAGHGYQLWYADSGGVHPLQTVSWDGAGTFVAPIGVDLAGSAAVMVTLESSGGASGEPGPQVVFGEL